MKYNNIIMADDDRFEMTSPRLMNLALSLVLVIMSGVGLLGMRETWMIVAALPFIAGLVIMRLLPDRLKYSGRRIYIYLGVEIALIVGLLILHSDNGGFGFLLLLPATEATIFFPIRRALLWVVSLFLVMALHSLLAWGQGGVVNILLNAGGYSFVAAFGYAIRQTELARRRSQALLIELQVAQQQLQALAVSEERNRLAREMHDALGHRLTVAVVQLEGAQRLIPSDPGRAGSMIQAMRAQLKEALAELRRTVSALRQDELPLDVTLNLLAQNFQESTGTQVHLLLPAELPPLSEAQSLALYRAAQEALTNAQRHAAASQAWLEILVEDGNIQLTARDDGKGVPEPAGAAPAGYGLRGLRERAEALGGDFLFVLEPGKGAQLTFRLPLSDLGEKNG
jgi:signal transduction histidine kinase